jgi:hypothetical protein
VGIRKVARAVKAEMENARISAVRRGQEQPAHAATARIQKYLTCQACVRQIQTRQIAHAERCTELLQTTESSNCPEVGIYLLVGSVQKSAGASISVRCLDRNLNT